MTGIVSTRFTEPGLSPAASGLRQLAAFGLLASGLCYLWFDVFGGVLRLVAPAFGLTLLIYLPSALALVSLGLWLLSTFGRPMTRRAGIALLMILLVVLGGGLISALLGRSLPQILMALYIWLPAFVFLALVEIGLKERLLRSFPAIFLIASLGVFLNIFIEMPWSAATYTIGEFERDASRKWSSGGMDRLAGFSRGSPIAAAQILFGYCVLESRLRAFSWRALWWGFGLAMIWFTNSKSALLAMVLLPPTLMLVGRLRHSQRLRRAWAAGALVLAWMGVVYIGPLLSVLFGNSYFGVVMGETVRSSFIDRVVNTWPLAISAMELESHPIHWLTGRGFGGIGVAQTMFEGRGNPGDNLAVYLFVSFGLMSLFFAWAIFRGAMAAIFARESGRRDFALIVSMLGVASMANTVEGIFTLMMLALALSCGRGRGV
ncbi:hypothetical protein HOY34_14055 [Xinfangfangia sp. D13-10-4-6]|uniref:hypothetical protein n=1 Tax=Pseudogemmobacter hezensis TaxID=2737662 RepID=UPI001557317E|nr:hypothetical protein [Pseudogemmobacter hezensis]NPD16319.1 hypothetical protein [Pseudogemmobacter hezensis]